MKYISVITPKDTGAPEHISNKTCYLCCFVDNTTGWCSIADTRGRAEEFECVPDNGPMIHWLKIKPKLPRNILVL